MLAYVIENYIRGDERVQSSLGSENRLETSKDAVLKRTHTESYTVQRERNPYIRISLSKAESKRDINTMTKQGQYGSWLIPLERISKAERQRLVSP